MNSRKPVIIKKVKKISAAGHHGGSWKVAYADFVTAMMAFFLLLWLLSMVSEEKRARISEYYTHFSLYSDSGVSFLSGSENNIFKSTASGAEKVLMERDGDEDETDDIQNNLNKAIADNLGDLDDQVLVEKTSDGIRIHLTDNEGSTMFESGSSVMTPKAKEVLKVIGENIKSLKNNVSIEGHTDALPFAGKNYSNWELSTERASSARRELESHGLNPGRLISVSGYADTNPLVKDDPNDARNRRISIILKFPKKDKEKQVGAQKPKDNVKQFAEELMNSIDKSAVSAGARNNKDAINNPSDSPQTNNQAENSVSTDNAAEPALSNNNFSPVISKEEWKLNLGKSQPMNGKDRSGPDTQQEVFSPVLGNDRLGPGIPVPEPMPEEKESEPVLNNTYLTPGIEKQGSISQELIDIIDTSTVTARGNSDRDSLNIIIDMPADDSSQTDSGLPAPENEDISGNADEEGNFSPVIDKKGWNPVF